ncbi:hypothetical protein [Pseudomonas sp. DTU12.1]|uniref:hypothetical protein n=1 Tax=Pseudomonas sp. DTU12.1 TaxID=2654238 RepID=UPI0015B68126|nr:hypothetical protein [Pseudomonas sp. DTU12.1]
MKKFRSNWFRVAVEGATSDKRSVCDKCGKWRAHGNHLKCSRRRQLQNAHLRNHKPKR